MTEFTWGMVVGALCLAIPFVITFCLAYFSKA